VESALEKAAAALGVPVEEIEYKVIDEGSTGFLGIGARDARIVAKIPVQLQTVETALEQDEATEETTSDLDDDAGDEEQLVTAEPNGSSEKIAEAAPLPDEVLLQIDGFLTRLVDAMGLDATVDVYEGEEAVVADVSSQQAGLFIGQKGETIDAVQHLVNVVVSRGSMSTKRIVVDSEGYRQRRIEALQGMAHRTARRVVKENRPVSLPPMPAAERRVVHLYLADNAKVETSSEGSEGNRYVVVSPT